MSEVGASLSPVPFSIDCVVGLGANLGDCEQTFGWAIEKIQHLGKLTSVSNLYLNPPVGGPPQPDYLNAAVRLTTSLSPHALLGALQQLEHAAGRERTVKFGPRTLDLDLLWVDGEAIDTVTLTVPHPRLLERAFALKPLVEVAPKAQCPLTGTSYSVRLSELDSSTLHCLATASGPPWQWPRQQLRKAASVAVAYP